MERLLGQIVHHFGVFSNRVRLFRLSFQFGGADVSWPSQKRRLLYHSLVEYLSISCGSLSPLTYLTYFYPPTGSAVCPLSVHTRARVGRRWGSRCCAALCPDPLAAKAPAAQHAHGTTDLGTGRKPEMHLHLHLFRTPRSRTQDDHPKTTSQRRLSLGDYPKATSHS